MNEKSILEQALLQVQILEDAVKANAKGILGSTMKQELNELLKESMEDEEEVVKEQPNPEEEEEDDDDTETVPNPEEEEDDNLDNNELTKGIGDMDSDDDDLSTDDNDFGSSSFDDQSMESDDDDTLDLTGASHDEVLKVFKSMKPEDGIVVKKDGNSVELQTGDDDYIIKLDEQDEDAYLDSAYEDRTHINDVDDNDDWENWDDDEEDDDNSFKYNEFSEEEKSEDNEETVYEITLDDETGKSVETKESSRTIGFGYHGGLKSKNTFKAGNKREEMNEEISKLKKQNSEYKKALVLFKEKLNEVAVFNANLAYSTRLFTEQSTTKQEKLNILKRFDSVSTMNESKTLFMAIKSELETKKPVTETVVSKISNTPSTSTSTEVLSESKAYENPQFKRIKEMMSKMK